METTKHLDFTTSKFKGKTVWMVSAPPQRLKGDEPESIKVGFRVQISKELFTKAELKMLMAVAIQQQEPTDLINHFHKLVFGKVPQDRSPDGA